MKHGCRKTGYWHFDCRYLHWLSTLLQKYLFDSYTYSLLRGVVFAWSTAWFEHVSVGLYGSSPYTIRFLEKTGFHFLANVRIIIPVFLLVMNTFIDFLQNYFASAIGEITKVKATASSPSNQCALCIDKPFTTSLKNFDFAKSFRQKVWTILYKRVDEKLWKLLHGCICAAVFECTLSVFNCQVLNVLQLVWRKSKGRRKMILQKTSCTCYTCHRFLSIHFIWTGLLCLKRTTS